MYWCVCVCVCACVCVCVCGVDDVCLLALCWWGHVLVCVCVCVCGVDGVCLFVSTLLMRSCTGVCVCVVCMKGVHSLWHLMSKRRLRKKLWKRENTSNNKYVIEYIIECRLLRSGCNLIPSHENFNRLNFHGIKLKLPKQNLLNKIDPAK